MILKYCSGRFLPDLELVFKKMNPKLEYEIKKIKSGYEYVFGVDEVGRGSLAGPLVVAAAVFNVNHAADATNTWVQTIKDSKQLSAKSRKNISEIIKENILGFEIVSIPEKIIDEINIHQAVLLGMKKACDDLKERSFGNIPREKIFCVFDGKFLPSEMLFNGECVTKGDDKIFTISAASILAKVYRDELMVEQSKSFPEYFWHENKGYGTVKHIEAIKQFGVTSKHRKTFCKNI